MNPAGRADNDRRVREELREWLRKNYAAPINPAKRTDAG